MASSYPTSLDTFTNPTGSDNQDSPDHATQHADANDAVEALEAKVGTGSGTPTEGKVLRGGATAGSATWQNRDIGYVNHGATAGTARPVGATSVKWVGSVEPTNATSADEWWDTTNGVLKSKASGSFVASGNTTYVGSSDDIVLGAHDAILGDSTASVVNTGGAKASMPYVAFADGASEYCYFVLGVGGGRGIPSSWTTMNVKLRWFNPGSNSGDVVWGLSHSKVSPGDEVNAAGNNTNAPDVTTTAPAQNFEADPPLTLASGVACPSGDQLIRLRLYRNGTAGGDTLTNDAGVMQVVLSKAS